MHSFPDLEPVCCSMSSSNCCFLTCIQVSQETGKVVWYFHLFKNFPQFVVIHTVKGFSIVNEVEVDVFLEFPCFLYDPIKVGNLNSGSSAFSKSNSYIWKFSIHVLLKPSLKDFEYGEWALHLSMSNQQTSLNCRTIKNKTDRLFCWGSTKLGNSLDALWF